MKSTLFIALLASLVLFSCKKDNEEDCPSGTNPSDIGTIRLNMNAYFGDEAFAVGNVYTNVNGYRVRIDDFKFYLSEASAIKEDGTLLPLSEIDLINLSSGNASREISLPTGNYNGIQFSIGVPPEQNKDQDPTVYPNTHPLSVNGAQGMFWSWNTGYIFVKFEGKADLEGQEGNELLSPFAFHCGEDVLFRTHVVDNLAFSIGSDMTTELNLNFQTDRFFYSDNDTIDIAVDNLTHTSGNLPLAERFTNLFNLAIEVE